jgi:hypothetical protein
MDKKIAALKSTILEELEIPLFDAKRQAETASTASIHDALERIAKSLGDSSNSHPNPSSAGPLPAAPATEREPPAAEHPKYLFQKAGSHWDVIFNGGGLFHLKDTLGTKYLDYMLHRPNEPFSAYDLEIAIQPEKADARPKDSIQGSLDSRARSDYHCKISEMRNEREKAVENADESKIERLDREIEDIETALKHGRQAPDAGERARGNVSKAVAAVRQKLRRGNQCEKAFGEHIRQFVSTGYECIYNQPQPGRIWA